MDLKSRRIQINQFIKQVKSQGDIVDQFDEFMWSSMVDKMIIGANSSVNLVFKIGIEIEV